MPQFSLPTAVAIVAGGFALVFSVGLMGAPDGQPGEAFQSAVLLFILAAILHSQRAKPTGGP